MKITKLNIEEMVQKLNEAPAEEKSTKIVELMQNVVSESQKELIEKYQAQFEEIQANQDNFAKYGLRHLSAEEKTFIDKLKDPSQLAGTFTNGSQKDLIPETIISYIFEDIKREHALLKYVKFTPAGLKKWLLSEKAGKAVWGKIDAKIVSELTATLSNLQIEANMLSAFAFLPKSIIEMGYEWIEKFIREILEEAIADGLEEGFIKGNGKDAPIGLIKKTSGATDGVYPDRTALEIEDFSIESLGEHFVTLTDEGKRTIGKVLLIVNPSDKYTKVAAASSYLTATGEYKSIFPFAIEVIESVHVAFGKAILYIPNTYVAGITEIGVEFSDHYQFLENNRVYKIVAYGNGRLVKENQAVYLNIANIKPLAFNVKNVSEVEGA